MPDTPRDWAEVVGILVLILLYLVRMVWSMLAKPVEPNGYDTRLRRLEHDFAELCEAGRGREKRIDQIGQKMSDIADEQQKWIGQAMDRYVTRRECERQHNRI